MEEKSETKIREQSLAICKLTKLLLDSVQTGEIDLEGVRNGENATVIAAVGTMKEVVDFCTELYNTAQENRKSDYFNLNTSLSQTPKLMNEFVESLTACCNNQYDYSLLQSLHSNHTKLIESLKRTIELATLLESGSSIQTQELLQNAVKKSVISIRKLSEMLTDNRGNASFVDFSEAARCTFETLLSLKSTASTIDSFSKDSIEKYGRLTTMFIKCAKEYFVNKEDASAKKNFEIIKQGIAKQIHEFVENYSSSSSSPLSSSQSLKTSLSSSSPSINNDSSNINTNKTEPSQGTNQRIPPSNRTPSAPKKLSHSASTNSTSTREKRSSTLVPSSSAADIVGDLHDTRGRPLPPNRIRKSISTQQQQTNGNNIVERRSSTSNAPPISEKKFMRSESMDHQSTHKWVSDVVESALNSKPKAEHLFGIHKMRRISSKPSNQNLNASANNNSNNNITNNNNNNNNLSASLQGSSSSSSLVTATSSGNLHPVTPRYPTQHEDNNKNESSENFTTIRQLSKQSNVLLSSSDTIINFLLEQFPNIEGELKGMNRKDRENFQKQISDVLLVCELQDRFSYSLPTLPPCDSFDSLKIFGTKASELLAHSYSLIRDVELNNQTFSHQMEKKFHLTLIEVLKSLKMVVGDVTSLSVNHSVNEKIKENTSSVLDLINSKLNFTLDVKNQSVLQFCKSHNIGIVDASLRALLWHRTLHLRVLSSREIATACSILSQKAASPQNLLIELISTAQCLIVALIEFYTTAVLAYETTKLKTFGTSSSSSLMGSEDSMDEILDIDIWSSNSKADNQSTIAPLNSLIELLTSDMHYDTNFMKSFICTYQSFTTPTQLFTKLKQRFTYPPSIQVQRGASIQMRVCVVLKYWVQNQFQDFDEKLINSLFEFLEKSVKQSGHTQLADIIIIQLLEKVRERQFLLERKVNAPPSPIEFFDLSQSAIELLFTYTPELIAEQLTLIDFNIFKETQPNELMNQAWNSNKLRWRAVNINLIMDRLNTISYWLATVILSFETLVNRVKAIEYFYQVAFHLRKLNNYHSLMGFVVGFNVSGITRLKYTIDAVDPKLIRQFKTIEELMNPSSSFKNYRKQLNTMKLPSIPYLGVYLTDLVFIEDGNPDEIDNKINFPKRELVYKTIQEIQVFQQSTYDLPVVDPINNLLRALPGLNDKQLHTLSLLREPRNCEKKDVL